MFIVRQDNQSEETLPINLVNTKPFDQFSNEGKPLNGPFKVPSDVLKKHYSYGNRTRDLIIEPLQTNMFKQKMDYCNIGNTSMTIEVDKNKSEVKEKRKPIVKKNSKPKQQVITIH